MVFSSLFFTFAFLPATVILYYLLGKRLRNIVLLAASLFFYAWGEPVYVLLMCVSILANYLIAILMGNVGSQKRKLLLIISLVLNLGCLAYFKYFGMVISTIASLGGLTLPVGIPALPIGISFYTFQILSYVIDVYNEKIKPQKSLLNCALYITMFPQLVAGPIVNYTDIESQLSHREITFEGFISGARRFLCGLAKKVLLANNIGLVWSQVKTLPSTELSMLMAWIGIIAFTLQIYFDFSGYSDMAIGLGRIFGFTFKENFQYPYISQSISEFWRRWHISLGSWFKEYVYFPLGGNRVGKVKLIRNLLVVWFLTGLWHGASWNFAIWGLYFGILVIVEKNFLQERMKRWPKVIRHLYSLLLIVIGWVFFEFTNFADGLSFLQRMFGLGGGSLSDSAALLQLKAYALLFIVSIFVASPLPKRLALALKRLHSKAYLVAENVFYCLVLFLATVYMVSSTYNPFIYFRF